MRYLSRSEKDKILANWSIEIQLGKPDPDIINLCNELNKIPGICTIQSCSGHFRNGYRECGHLWLRLMEDFNKKFVKRAFMLSSANGIERVSTIYSSWGEEIVNIEFEGNERPSPNYSLNRSIENILEFFKFVEKVKEWSSVA